jgi:hypothetical protein
MEKQITETFKKAFYDSLEQAVMDDKVDYDWLVRLYKELRERLIKFVRKESKLYNQIQNDFDDEFFEMLIRNEVFDYYSMRKLIINTFDWIMELQAPQRDETTKNAMLKVLDTPYNKIVPVFIKEANECLDLLDDDMNAYLLSKSAQL